MEIRLVKSSDYNNISPLINDWWGGRQMSDMLPKLFFVHFNNTSFIAEKDSEIIGFLIGFLSQSYANEAYIHFVGVHPEYRKYGIGKQLYKEFFKWFKNIIEILFVLSPPPVNKVSIAYHKKMGFEIEEGDSEVNGVPVHTSYDGSDQGRVLFKKYLG